VQVEAMQEHWSVFLFLTVLPLMGALSTPMLLPKKRGDPVQKSMTLFMTLAELC
jgi:hypothetical protein